MSEKEREKQRDRQEERERETIIVVSHLTYLICWPGLRVQETGFWVPKEDHPMHGLIGASPDGVVVSDKENSRVLGLVEFKAPVYKLYDKTAGSTNGIPRRYMVQVLSLSFLEKVTHSSPLILVCCI